MIRRQFLRAVGMGAVLRAIPASGAPPVVTDAAGRRVAVPSPVDRVIVAGPPAAIFVYTLAPERLLGWTRAPSADEQAFMPARYAALPALGRLTGRGNTANVEVVLAAKPDVIVDYGALGPTYASLADRVQGQTGIPYVLLDGSLSAIPRTYEMLGAVLGVADRARELARWTDRFLRDVDRRVAAVPATNRPSVYYARGPRGLETGLRGSINVESLERIGARNVAADRPAQSGIATVSLEQILAWDPEVIVTIEPAFLATARDDARWRSLRAVRDGRVYLAPLQPFPWIDFPPSVNRLIGLAWLGRLLYPREFGDDLRDQARDFYARFYHRAPDDRQLDALLAGALPARH